MLGAWLGVDSMEPTDVSYWHISDAKVKSPVGVARDMADLAPVRDDFRFEDIRFENMAVKESSPAVRLVRALQEGWECFYEGSSRTAISPSCTLVAVAVASWPPSLS